MAQGYGQYNQFGGYGQIPGQADQSRFPRFGQGQRQDGGQYPQGTFQGQQSGQQQGQNTNTSNLSQPPPTGSPNPTSGQSSTAAPTTSTPAPPPVTSGAAGQQAPDTQYPAGTFQNSGTTALYGGSLGQNSTGPVNMMLGQLGAPGAWDGGYNPQYAPAPMPAPAAATTLAATAAAPTAPVSTPQPAAPAANDPSNPANWSLIQRQILGLAPRDMSATAAYNAQQQQFTGNNQGYGASGYQGNNAQVLTQMANGAQSAGIPLGVLGSSFYRGGSDYGGQQTAQNSMSGNNGATDWTGSTYGVDLSNPQLVHGATAELAAARAKLGYPPGTFR